MSRKSIREKAAGRRKIEVDFHGDNIHCALQTIGSMESFKNLLNSMDEENANQTTIEFLAKQYTDVDDGKPIWTAQEMTDELCAKDIQFLLKKFFEVNSDGEVKALEKN